MMICLIFQCELQIAAILILATQLIDMVSFSEIIRIFLTFSHFLDKLNKLNAINNSLHTEKTINYNDVCTAAKSSSSPENPAIYTTPALSSFLSSPLRFSFFYFFSFF